MRSILWTVILVGTGGFAGAVLRYGLSGLVHRRLPFETFPVGTLVVNVVGCLSIGLLTGLADSRQLFGPEGRAFALVGLLGGFTTFSTFGYESFALLRDGEFLRAGANVLLQVTVGLASVWLGYTIGTSR